MDFNKLYYFYITAKCEHITRASAQLHIAQPSLTKAIKLLESELGAPLFYRHKRNIYLTPFGKMLKERLDGVFPILDEIQTELDDIKGVSADTVNVNVLAASAIVTEAIVNYKKHNPKTIFQAVQNETEKYCDISVSTNAVDDVSLPPFVKKCVVHEDIYLAVSTKSKFAQRKSINLYDVGNESFISLAGSRQFRALSDMMCRQAQIEPKIIFESDSPVSVRNLICSNIGIGFWPAFSWGEKPEDIVFLPIDNVVCQREIILGYHSGRHNAKASNEFYEFLVDFIKAKQI